MIAGWKDSRVPYWEPLKFAAALRHSTLAERPVLVKTDNHAGHSFGSNRTKYFEELAWIYTFVLDQISKKNAYTSSLCRTDDGSMSSLYHHISRPLFVGRKGRGITCPT